MAALTTTELKLFLICRAGALLCALRAEDVVEMMRPQPLKILPGAPEFVSGVSIVRGEALPIVVLSRLLDGGQELPTRLVVVRTGMRRVGLAVDEFVGIRSIQSENLQDLPPLITPASQKAIAEISSLDGELLVVLEAAKLVSEEVYQLLNQWAATA